MVGSRHCIDNTPHSGFISRKKTVANCLKIDFGGECSHFASTQGHCSLWASNVLLCVSALNMKCALCSTLLFGCFYQPLEILD